MFALIIVPALIALGAFYICYRQLSILLEQDLDWVYKAFKDVLIDRPKGSYPVTLKGMDTVIASMVRFNREVEKQGLIAARNANDDFELEGYFDDIGGPIAASNVSITEPTSVAAKGQEITIENLVQDKPAVIDKPVETPKKFDENAAIFKAYDIRGIVGKTLTKEIVYDIGRAVGYEAKELGCKTVVVGRDGRISSPSLAEALSQGIVSTGCHVLDIGMIPTPILYFVVQHTDGRTGIMLTGSHNPSEYNGLKIMIKGETLAGPRIQQIKQRIDNNAFATGEGYRTKWHVCGRVYRPCVKIFRSRIK